MSISAPDRLEGPRAEQARLNFNRSAVNASAWLRMRTGYDPHRSTLPVKHPAWLGGSGEGGGSLPASVNNAMASLSMPSGGAARPVNQDALRAAQAQFNAMQGSNSMFAKLNRNMHTGTNLGLQGVFAPLEVVRNMALATMRDVEAFANHPSATGFWNAVMPDPEEAIADTTVNAFVNTVQKHGWDYAISPEGVGTGYTLDPQSAVWKEKEDLAAHFYTLSNGDPATMGRYFAAMVGADKDTTFYKTFSGTIDALTLLMDPLNLVIPQAKLAKVGAGVATRATAVNAGLKPAAEAIQHLPGMMGSAEARAAFNADAGMQEIVAKANAVNPNLAPAVEAVQRQVLGGHTEDSWLKGMLAANINGAGIKNSHLIEAKKYLDFEADTAAKATVESEKQIGDLTIQIAKTRESIEDLALKHDEQLAKGDTAGAALTATERAGYVASKEELETLRAAHKESVAQVTATRENLLREVTEQDALQGRFEAELGNHATLSAAEQQAAANAHRAGIDLQARTYETLGDMPVPALGDIRAGASAIYGFTDEGVNMVTALQGLVRGPADAAAELAVGIDNVADMLNVFGNGIDVSTLNLLVKTTDKQEALTILAKQAIDGEVGHFSNRAALYLSNRGAQIGGERAAVRRWEGYLKETGRRARPNAAWANVESVDDVVKLWMDQVSSAAVLAHRSKRGGAEDWWNFRNDGINRLAATDGSYTSTLQVMIKLQDELIERIPGWATMTDDAKNGILKQLGRLRQEQRIGNERAVVQRAEMGVGGKQSAQFGKLHDPSQPSRVANRLIRSGADLSHEITILNPDALRKLYRAVDTATGLQKTGKWTAQKQVALNELFDKELRPLYLTFRPGYMALQIADGAMRSMLMGATNPISNPLRDIAIVSSMVTGERPLLAKITGNLTGAHAVGADGLPALGSIQTAWLSRAQGLVDNLESSRILKRNQYRDVLTDRTVRTVEQGFIEVEQGASKFHKSWAEDAGRYFIPDVDPMFDAVLTARVDGVLTKEIEEWATVQWGGTPIASIEDVVTEYFYNGPGKTYLATLGNANRKTDGLADYMSTIYRDRDKLKSYLFDEDEALSHHNMASLFTGGFDKGATAMLRDVAKGHAEFLSYLERLSPRQAKKVTKQGWFKDVRVGNDVHSVDFSKATDSLVGGWLKGMGLREPTKVQARNIVEVPTTLGPKDTFDSWIDSFFGMAATGEKRAIQGPFLIDEITLQTARRLSVLSPKDADLVAKRLLENNIPKMHKSPKLKEAKRLIEQGVRAADGDGTWSIEDITVGANKAATDELKQVMYGLKGRNASAQRMSLLFPFVQSSANGYRTYTKGIAQNPTRAVNAMRGWQNAHTEDSGVLYDIMPGVERDDPTQPLIWTDTYGQQKFSVPFLGYAMNLVDSAMGLLPFYDSNPYQTSYLDVNVGKWNPTNYGEPLPGVGMGVTVPASAIRAVAGDAALPSWMEEYIYPFEGSDVAQDQGVLYANAPGFIKMLFPSPQQQMMSTGTAMSALMATNPDKYADPATGYVSQEGASLLARDAHDLAKSLAAAGQVRNAIFRGGVSQPKTVVDLTTGKAMSAALLYDEYEKMKEETTDGQAKSFILDKYGMAGVSYLIGKRESASHATDEGYEFARVNPDVLDSSPDVLGYFFPASELKYRSPKYDRLLSRLDEGHQKTPESFAEDVNRFMKQAREARLDELVAANKITASQYKTEKAILSAEYGTAVQGEFNTKHFDDNHLQLRSALGNQELAASSVGQSLAKFYEVYEAVKPTLDGGTFDGKKDRRQREAMVATGEALADVNPAFRPLWDSQLKWEFRED